MWDTGPRITPSTSFACTRTESGMVLPEFSRALKPTSASVTSSDYLQIGLKGESTDFVADVISGPIPSPARNNSFSIVLDIVSMIYAASKI